MKRVYRRGLGVLRCPNKVAFLRERSERASMFRRAAIRYARARMN